MFKEILLADHHHGSRGNLHFYYPDNELKVEKEISYLGLTFSRTCILQVLKKY